METFYAGYFACPPPTYLLVQSYPNLSTSIFLQSPCPTLCLRRLKFADIFMTPCALEHIGDQQVESGVFFLLTPHPALSPQFLFITPEPPFLCQVSLLPPLQLQLPLASANSIFFLCFLSPRRKTALPL